MIYPDPVIFHSDITRPYLGAAPRRRKPLEAWPVILRDIRCIYRIHIYIYIENSYRSVLYISNKPLNPPCDTHKNCVFPFFSTGTYLFSICSRLEGVTWKYVWINTQNWGFFPGKVVIQLGRSGMGLPRCMIFFACLSRQFQM